MMRWISTIQVATCSDQKKKMAVLFGVCDGTLSWAHSCQLLLTSADYTPCQGDKWYCHVACGPVQLITSIPKWIIGVLSLWNAIRVCIIRNGVIAPYCSSPHFVPLVPVRTTLLLFAMFPFIGLYEGHNHGLAGHRVSSCVAQAQCQSYSTKKLMKWIPGNHLFVVK